MVVAEARGIVCGTSGLARPSFEFRDSKILPSKSAGALYQEKQSGRNRGRLHRAKPRLDPEGHAGTLAVNTLAPYILTALIERAGRLVYLSSGLHRGGEGSLGDLDWTKRPWDGSRACAESKLHVVALAFRLARRWPQILSNAVDPGWARTKMGGPGAPVDLETGQRTQTSLVISDEPAALVSGRYWHHLRQEQPAGSADPKFQEQLIAKLGELTGVALPRAQAGRLVGAARRRPVARALAARNGGACNLKKSERSGTSDGRSSIFQLACRAVCRVLYCYCPRYRGSFYQLQE